MEVMVKHKVTCPHEEILGGVNRSCMTYDQLTLSQWVQGYWKNILAENDKVDLMEDTTVCKGPRPNMP